MDSARLTWAPLVSPVLPQTHLGSPGLPWTPPDSPGLPQTHLDSPKLPQIHLDLWLQTQASTALVRVIHHWTVGRKGKRAG